MTSRCNKERKNTRERPEDQAPRQDQGQRDRGRIAQVVRSLPYKCKASGYDAREAGTPRGFQPKQRLDRALPEPAVHGVATAREGGQDRRTEEATRQEQTDRRKPQDKDRPTSPQEGSNIHLAKRTHTIYKRWRHRII